MELFGYRDNTLMKILIVDDYKLVRQNIRSSLKNLGFKDIAEAKDGKEAYGLIASGYDPEGKKKVYHLTPYVGKIDLCIADWNMPVMSGLDLLKKIREDERLKDMVFIMLTAERDAMKIKEAIKYGVDEYIVKPFTIHTIMKKLVNITLLKFGPIQKEMDDFFTNQTDKGSILDTKALSEKKMTEFEKKILKATEMVPWSHHRHVYLGKMYLEFHEYKKAEQYARAALSKEPFSPVTQNLLQTILRARGKIPETVKELRIAVQEKPKSTELLLKFGEALLKEGDFDEALGVLEKAKALLEGRKEDKKLLAKTMNTLGNAQFEKGTEENNNAIKEEGVSNIEGAVNNDPELLAAHYNLMVVYKKSGRTDEALKILKKISSMEPKDADGWLAHGKSYLDNFESKRAVFAFKKAEDLADGEYRIFEEISLALYKKKMYHESSVFLKKARECDPSNTFSYNLIGIIYRLQKRFNDAIEQYRHAVKIDPEDATLYFNLGRALLDSGKMKEGNEMFKKAQELDPELDVAEFLAE